MKKGSRHKALAGNPRRFAELENNGMRECLRWRSFPQLNGNFARIKWFLTIIGQVVSVATFSLPGLCNATEVAPKQIDVVLYVYVLDGAPMAGAAKEHVDKAVEIWKTAGVVLNPKIETISPDRTKQLLGPDEKLHSFYGPKDKEDEPGKSQRARLQELKPDPNALAVFFVKTDIQSRADPDRHQVYIDNNPNFSPPGRTVAHEIGHLLLGAGHSGQAGVPWTSSLMEDAGTFFPGTRISDEDAMKARTTASTLPKPSLPKSSSAAAPTTTKQRDPAEAVRAQTAEQSRREMQAQEAARAAERARQQAVEQLRAMNERMRQDAEQQRRQWEEQQRRQMEEQQRQEAARQIQQAAERARQQAQADEQLRAMNERMRQQEQEQQRRQEEERERQRAREAQQAAERARQQADDDARRRAADDARRQAVEEQIRRYQQEQERRQATSQRPSGGVGPPPTQTAPTVYPPH